MIAGTVHVMHKGLAPKKSIGKESYSREDIPLTLVTPHYAGLFAGT